MKDTRSINRTVRIGAATYDAADPNAADQLQSTLTPAQGQWLQERGAISGEGWEFTGQEDQQGTATAAADPRREPDGSPYAVQAGTQGTTGTTGTKAPENMTRRELEQEIARRGLDINDVQGTGSGGNLVNADLVKFLNDNPAAETGGSTPVSDGTQGETGETS